MLKTLCIATLILGMARGAVAQTADPVADAQTHARQRIATMEVILQQAVTNGADNVLRQVQNVMPDRPMLNGAPRARGVRLQGYGVFFQVQVPSLILPVMWPLRQLTQDNQNRQLMALLDRMQLEVARLEPGESRRNLQLQIADLQTRLTGATRPEAGRVSAASLVAGQGQVRPVDQTVLDDPQSAYTSAVKASLIEAMLEQSQGLTIADNEWLVVAASDDAPRNPLFPGDDSSTWVMRVKGSDLMALRTKSISPEEARQRVEIREE